MVSYKWIEEEAEAVKGRGQKKKKPTKDLVAQARDLVKGGRAEIIKFLLRVKEFEGETEEDLAKLSDAQGLGKKLKDKMIEAGEKLWKPPFKTYKDTRAVVMAEVELLIEADKLLKKKSADLGYKIAMKKREEEERAKKEAEALQKKLDEQQKELEAKEIKRAEKEKREPELPARIEVPTPVLTGPVKVKTEHGTMNIDFVLKGTVTDIKSEYVHRLILTYCEPAYKTMADVAIKKAIEAGALGKAGGPGVTVTEVVDPQHRKR